MVYEWISMNNYFKCDAQTVGETMEKIEAVEGSVTKENFLEASRPENSPTHGLFEWNDTVAAEKYRLQQSHDVITHIAVKVEKMAEDEKTVRAFVNVENTHVTKGRFVNIATAMKNESMRQVVLRNAVTELKMFEKKYQTYTELQGVFDAIDKLDIEVA